jgi:hypothetical protein
MEDDNQESDSFTVELDSREAFVAFCALGAINPERSSEHIYTILNESEPTTSNWDKSLVKGITHKEHNRLYEKLRFEYETQILE